jgi:hypothetical protein
VEAQRFKMERSLVLPHPLFEDTNLFTLESLLGRCVSYMASPTDDFAPNHDLPLHSWLNPFTAKPPKITFKQYLKANSDKGMEVKITDLLAGAHKQHSGTEVDVETAEAISLDLIQLPSAYEVLSKQKEWQSSGKALCKRNERKAYWITGITIVTGSKVKSTQSKKDEKTMESTIPIGKGAAAAAAAHGVPPGVIPLEGLDLTGKYSHTTETENRQEMDVTGRCMLSIRYALLKYHRNFHGGDLVYERRLQKVAHINAVEDDDELVEEWDPLGNTIGSSETVSTFQLYNDTVTYTTEEGPREEDEKEEDKVEEAEEKEEDDKDEEEDDEEEFDEAADIELEDIDDELYEDLEAGGGLVISHNLPEQ